MAVVVEEVCTPRVTKLSASGLVVNRHYGRSVIQNIYTPTLCTKELDLVYTKMHDSFMEAIDANDTGVERLYTQEQ